MLQEGSDLSLLYNSMFPIYTIVNNDLLNQGRASGQMAGWTERLMDGWIDRWMNEWMKRRTVS